MANSLRALQIDTSFLLEISANTVIEQSYVSENGAPCSLYLGMCLLNTPLPCDSISRCICSTRWLLYSRVANLSLRPTGVDLANDRDKPHILQHVHPKHIYSNVETFEYLLDCQPHIVDWLGKASA